MLELLKTKGFHCLRKWFRLIRNMVSQMWNPAVRLDIALFPKAKELFVVAFIPQLYKCNICISLPVVRTNGLQMAE